jgi:hypothetical protein
LACSPDIPAAPSEINNVLARLIDFGFVHKVFPARTTNSLIRQTKPRDPLVLGFIEHQLTSTLSPARRIDVVRLPK